MWGSISLICISLMVTMLSILHVPLGHLNSSEDLLLLMMEERLVKRRLWTCSVERSGRERILSPVNFQGLETSKKLNVSSVSFGIETQVLSWSFLVPWFSGKYCLYEGMKKTKAGELVKFREENETFTYECGNSFLNSGWVSCCSKELRPIRWA